MNKNFLSITNMSSLNNFLQMIGVLGVIASLIFVGLELRQSQKIALAKTQQERNNSAYDVINTFTTANIDWQSVVLDNNLSNQFSKQMIARRNAYHLSWFMFENDFFQYTQGLVDDSVWDAKLKAFENWYNTCDLRPLYVRRSKYMPAAFTTLIESFPDKCAE
ncbi:MAG: hypothetical protein CMO98_07735 [Woeseia sp.]|nr:hypothetical protein [Woeseia sp.]|tara:strand:- start:24 stop:512 length:489 start_codon:yes stop_codon:yes gene_type:complete